ncbi:MAG TPA: O-antigen polymerase [Hyphomicrobiaceae bacterium]|nr:O-antigen polymerase [Hyphomicrobiaceae bacterium]
MKVSSQAPMRAAGPFRPARAEMRLRTAATLFLVMGALLASTAARMAGSTNEAFSLAAATFGCAVAIALFIESRPGVRSLFRVDIFMIVVLYGLTFLEFLFPQDDLSFRLTPDDAWSAIDVTLCAFVGLALGRHAVTMYAGQTLSDMAMGLSPSRMFGLLLACTLVGYAHILLAVNFDVFEALRQMTWPRFTQAWTRGRTGGASALLSELGLLIFLLPPLVGAILAEHQRYRAYQKAVALLILALTLFYGFSGGTRYVFLTYLATFGASYLMLRPNISWSSLILVGLPLAVMAAAGAYYMAALRTLGLDNWELAVERTDRVFVDMNILNIAGLIQVFPDQHDYLGLEVPFIAAIRPIPRVLWSGKPEGLSISIEEVLGAQGWTLSATYVGELWMAGGLFAVVLASLIFGAAGARWNRLGATAQGNLDKIVFATGFFAAGLGMRSFLGVAPAILPTLALYIFRRWHDRDRKRKRRPLRHEMRPRKL